MIGNSHIISLFHTFDLIFITDNTYVLIITTTGLKSEYLWTFNSILLNFKIIQMFTPDFLKNIIIN